jgi:hypothetical protein
MCPTAAETVQQLWDVGNDYFQWAIGDVAANRHGRV